MAKLNATRVASYFGRAVLDELHLTDTPYADYMKIRNKRESMETDSAGAAATITFEGAGELMVEMTLQSKWIEFARQNGFYFEPYSSWQIAVWPL